MYRTTLRQYLAFTVLCLLCFDVTIAGKDKNTPAPTDVNGNISTEAPSVRPTIEPTSSPSLAPSPSPSFEPSSSPTSRPSLAPSPSPSVEPSSTPTVEPSSIPTLEPTQFPTLPPSTQLPTLGLPPGATQSPTEDPVSESTLEPSTRPTTAPPSRKPVESPLDLREVEMPKVEVGMVLDEAEALALTAAVVEDELTTFMNQALFLITTDIGDFQSVDLEVNSLEILNGRSLRDLQEDGNVQVHTATTGIAFFDGEPVPTPDDLGSLLTSYFQVQGNVLLELHLLESDDLSSVRNVQVTVDGQETWQNNAGGFQGGMQPDGNSSNDTPAGLIAGLVIGIVAFVAAVVFFVWQRRRASKKMSGREILTSGGPNYSHGLSPPQVISQREGPLSEAVPSSLVFNEDDMLSLDSSLYTTNTDSANSGNNGQYDAKRLDKVVDLVRTTTSSSERC